MVWLPLVGMVAVIVLLWRTGGTRALTVATTRWPLVTRRRIVIIPARNEALSIEVACAAIVSQLRPDDVLMVVDDHSTDDTAARAARVGARVISASTLPDTWRGKCWACWSGVTETLDRAATDGDLLVFVDADVALQPGALDRLDQLQATNGGMVSFLPHHRPGSTAEQLSLFGNLAAAMGSGAFAPIAHSVTTAFGPVLAMDRAVYDDVGGHEAVRTELVEDIALARLIDPVTVVCDRSLATYRMYPGGWSEVSAGWIRNLRLGITRGPWWATLAVALWITAIAGGPFAWWGWYPIAVMHLAWCARRVGRFAPWAIVLYPIALAVFVVLALRSGFTRRLRWRGRLLDR